MRARTCSMIMRTAAFHGLRMRDGSCFCAKSWHWWKLTASLPPELQAFDRLQSSKKPHQTDPANSCCLGGATDSRFLLCHLPRILYFFNGIISSFAKGVVLAILEPWTQLWLRSIGFAMQWPHIFYEIMILALYQIMWPLLVLLWYIWQFFW